MDFVLINTLVGCKQSRFRGCTSTSGSTASPMAYRLLCVRFTALVHAPHSPLTIRALRRRCNTRYGWVVSPYPTGTRTPQDTPSFAWHNNETRIGRAARRLRKATAIQGVGCGAWLGQEPEVSHSGASEDKRRWVSGEALKTRGDAAGGTLVGWPSAATHLANPQGLGMAVLSWRFCHLSPSMEATKPSQSLLVYWVSLSVDWTFESQRSLNRWCKVVAFLGGESWLKTSG